MKLKATSLRALFYLKVTYVLLADPDPNPFLLYGSTSGKSYRQYLVPGAFLVSPLSGLINEKTLCETCSFDRM